MAKCGVIERSININWAEEIFLRLIHFSLFPSILLHYVMQGNSASQRVGSPAFLCCLVSIVDTLYDIIFKTI